MVVVRGSREGEVGNYCSLGMKFLLSKMSSCAVATHKNKGREGGREGRGERGREGRREGKKKKHRKKTTKEHEGIFVGGGYV